MGSSRIGSVHGGTSSKVPSTTVRLVPARGGFAVDSSDAGPAEPVGIVIAGPRRMDVAPRVLAYVWGLAPELVAEDVVEQWAA